MGLYSCTKTTDYDEYLPEVKIISATAQLDGSVLVKAEIINEGEAPIEYVGFCCSTSSTPEMLDRQIVSDDLIDDKFEAFYVQLSEDSTYNFRAWATNEFGYSYSKTFSLDSLVFPTIDPPCNLPMEYLNTGLFPGSGTFSGSHNLIWVNSLSLYRIEGSIYPIAGISIYVDSPLTQGLYTTTDQTFPGYKQMHVSFTQGQPVAQYYVLSPGSTIYVKTISQGIFDLTICNAPWLYNYTTLKYFNTRLTAIN